MDILTVLSLLRTCNPHFPILLSPKEFYTPAIPKRRCLWSYQSHGHRRAQLAQFLHNQIVYEELTINGLTFRIRLLGSYGQMKSKCRAKAPPEDALENQKSDSNYHAYKILTPILST